MTIYWKISSGELQVWITSDPATNPPEKTTERKFGNPVSPPPELYDLAYEKWSELTDEPPRDFQTGDEIMADVIFRQFEEIPPEDDESP